MYKKILVAVDGSEVSTRAIKHTMHLAQALRIPVAAVYVIDTHTLPRTRPAVPKSMESYYESLVEEMRRIGESAVEEAVEEGERAGVSVECSVIEGAPADGIIAEGERVSADLIVLGTHGRSSIKTLVLGSTAHAVSCAAQVPVLLVRDRRARVRARPPLAPAEAPERRAPRKGRSDRGSAAVRRGSR